MVDLHLPGPSGATLRVWPGGTRSLRLSWPTGQLPSGTWRLVAAGLDLTGTVDGDVVSWALTVDQVRAVLGQRWAVWCSTATDHPVLAGQVLEQRPLPGAGDGVSVEVAVVDGDPVVVEVGGPGGGLSEVEVQALIDAALAGLDPGVVLSDATPQAPGAAGPGVSVEASRADHRHAPPTAGQIGAATPADIEAAIDAIPGPPTAVFAVADLDMSGGSWTELPGAGLPRMLLVGHPVLVLSGDDRGLWTVTASGPCTPLPDPGGAVIAVTAQQTVASPIVDQMGQPAGWVLVPSAETVLVLDTTVSTLGSTVTTLGSTVTALDTRVSGDLAAETAARQTVDVAVERLRAGGGLDGARWLLVGDHGDGPITWSTPRPVTWTGELVVVADMVPLPPLAGPSSPPVFAEVATCPHASVDFDSPEAAIRWTDGRPALFGEAALDGAAEVNLGEDPETRITGDWGRPGNATHWPEAGEPTAAAGSRGRWLWQWLGDDGAGRRAAGIARPAMPGETPDLTHDGTDWVWILRRVEPGASDIACVGPDLTCGLNPGVGTAVASVEWWTGVGGSRFARVHPDDIDGDELVDPHGNTWSSIGATPLLLDRRWSTLATPIT